MLFIIIIDNIERKGLPNLKKHFQNHHHHIKFQRIIKRETRINTGFDGGWHFQKQYEEDKKEVKKIPNKKTTLPKQQESEKKEISKRENLEKALKDSPVYKGNRKQLASDLGGISVRQIGHYITGATAIPEDKLIKLSELLDVSPEYILGKTNHPEKGLHGLLKDIYDNNMSIYMPVYKLLESVGFQFRWHEKDKCLYMNPKGSEPIPIDNQLHTFFCNQIRNYAKNLFTDYYNSSHAFEYRMDLIRKNIKNKGSDKIEIERGYDPQTSEPFERTYINGELKGGDANDLT